jgi:hypothetical protein
MTDRDWSKEMKKIDRQLESVSDEALFPAKTGPAGATGSAAPRASASVPDKPRSTFGAFARLTLSVLLGVGIVFWPYEARCGLGLFAYLAAVLVVGASGIWSAVWTWRHHTGRAHVLSLLLILWGLVLAGTQVLPRVGYAKPDIVHPALWACR